MSKQLLLLHALNAMKTRLRQAVRKKTPMQVANRKGSRFLSKLLELYSETWICFGVFGVEL